MKRKKTKKKVISRRSKGRAKVRRNVVAHKVKRQRRPKQVRRAIKAVRKRKALRPRKLQMPAYARRTKVKQMFKAKAPERTSALERSFETFQRAPAQQLAAHPNMIVTFDPNKTASARAEIERLLRDVKETARIEESAISGIFKLTVSDPKSIVRKMVETCRNSPERFNRTFHWTPIERWCRTDVEGIQNIIREMAQNIHQNDSWKMTIEKRQCDHHERELISKWTGVVEKGNVDLADPDKIIKVDILGDETGISILNRGEFLNVTKFRR